MFTQRLSTLFLPLGVLLAGATVTSIGLTGCFVYSLYNGYQEGKRGRSLVAHPFVSAGRLLDVYKFFTGFQPVATEHVEPLDENMILMEEYF
jgi:hypothetical protein